MGGWKGEEAKDGETGRTGEVRVKAWYCMWGALAGPLVCAADL